MFYFSFEKHCKEFTKEYTRKDDNLNFSSILRKEYIIDSNIGNNKFCYCTNRKIIIPPIIQGNDKDIVASNNIVFREKIDNTIISYPGLQNYIIGYTKNSNTPLFICDNHNAVLEAWVLLHKSQLQLVHIDQHRDDGLYNDELSDWKEKTVISNYIDFAIRANWIKKDYFSFIEQQDIMQINEIYKMPVILNIDLDFFSKDMSIISLKDKLKLITKFAINAKLITIATSPGFIEQERAIKLAKLLFQYL